MPQLDQFTYFTQFFWSCLFFFTFYFRIYKMEGEKQNFRSTSSPSTSSSASGDPERDPERARLLLLYEGLYKSIIQDVRAEAELLLKKKLNFQTVSGLVQQRVPKVGTDYEIISDMKIELGPDHPLVQFVLKQKIVIYKI